MGKVEPFHSRRRREVHHDRDDCPQGQRILESERLPGTGGLPLCFFCASTTSIESARQVPAD
jgi:hypothetical protein